MVDISPEKKAATAAESDKAAPDWVKEALVFEGTSMPRGEVIRRLLENPEFGQKYLDMLLVRALRRSLTTTKADASNNTDPQPPS